MSSLLRSVASRTVRPALNAARSSASAAVPASARFAASAASLTPARSYHADAKTEQHLRRTAEVSPQISGQLAYLKKKEVYITTDPGKPSVNKATQTANVPISRESNPKKEYDPAIDQTAHEMQHLVDVANGASRGNSQENLHLEFRAFIAQERVSKSAFERPPESFRNLAKEKNAGDRVYHSAKEMAIKYVGKKNYPGTLEESTDIFNSNRKKAVPPVGS